MKTKARYIAVDNDKIIPPDYAAPPGYPVIVLSGVSMLSPHTSVLKDPFVKLTLLRWLEI